MTDERKNEIWQGLPNDFKKRVKEMFGAYPDTAMAYRAIADLFGKNNLTAQAEEKPKEQSKIGNSDKSIIDYAQYRLDLAKEIAVAMVGNNDGYGGIACESVAIANEIVKRLKETADENA